MKLRYDYPDWDGKDYYYHFSPGEIISVKVIKSGFTEITFEQFIKYVLKEDCKQYSKAAFNICTGYVNKIGIIRNVDSANDIEKFNCLGNCEVIPHINERIIWI